LESHSRTHVIVGGGAAGFFGAITCAQFHPSDRVILLEKSNQLLTKVKISGGGRCNVTHACFDPVTLTHYYPRGSKELRGPFSRFQPKDTIQWFESRGVQLKVEEDGRMFPVTDHSETIIQCLQQEAIKQKVEVCLLSGVNKIERAEKKFILLLANGEYVHADSILMATGSSPKVYEIVKTLGHTVIPLVPSLFTFNIPTSPLIDLAGISIPHVHLTLKELGLEQKGSFLLTHWGFSGPAVLKLSAWGARELHDINYQTTLIINWIPDYSEGELREKLSSFKEELKGRQLGSESLFNLPKQLWRRLIQLSGIDPDLRWSMLSNKQLNLLVVQLRASSFKIEGKTTYKQEFVTCGGVNLDEINFKTMESRLCSGLYFAGEILNIDGVTGGFNFQNAWTTGWIAGQSMGRKN
jgi:predicted Rossmann fold flavoprotein